MGPGLGPHVGLGEEDDRQWLRKLLVEHVPLVQAGLAVLRDGRLFAPVHREVVIIHLVAIRAPGTSPRIGTSLGEIPRRILPQLGNEVCAALARHLQGVVVATGPIQHQGGHRQDGPSSGSKAVSMPVIRTRESVQQASPGTGWPYKRAKNRSRPWVCSGFRDDDFITRHAVDIRRAVEMVPKEHPKQHRPREDGREQALDGALAAACAGPAGMPSMVMRPVISSKARVIRLKRRWGGGVTWGRRIGEGRHCPAWASS